MSHHNNKTVPAEIKVKIVLLGDGAVGKTTLKRVFMGKGFEGRYLPTLGADVTLMTINIGSDTLKCRIWDLAGQPKFNNVRKLYYRGSIGAILVYDISVPESLYNLKNWIQELEKNNTRTKIPLVIVGNKTDLRPSIPSCLTTEQGQIFTNSLGEELKIEDSLSFFETSAKSNTNVNDVFRKLGEQVLKILGE